VVDDEPALAWVVNLGCIELHPHPVRSGDLVHPDELRIDLDPTPGVAWSDVRRVTLETRKLLEELGLTGWPKTSGSRGMHVLARIQPRWTFAEVRRAALALSREVERRMPGRATSKWWKEERRGVFLDYNQNAKDRTTCSAYSVRPSPDARVSAPLAWKEVARCDASDFTVATMPRRFAKLRGPARGHRRNRGVARRAARARRARRGCGPRGRALATALRQGARRSAARRAVACARDARAQGREVALASSSAFYRPGGRRRVNRLISATNSADPMIDHTTGKVAVSIVTAKGSGRPNLRASHAPNRAPMKPTAMAVMQPPREKPAIAWPIAPHTPATANKTSSSSRVMARG
jgi:hypothetical protein